MQKYKLFAAAGAVVALGAVGFSVPVTGPTAEAAPGTVESTETSVIDASVTAPVTLASTPAEAAPAPEPDPAPEPARAPALETMTGSASYYADMFEGRTTASGVPFRQAEMWAAHRTLPFGTRLRVTSLTNGNEVEVEVVDRGPYAHGRVLDLSKAAARKLDFVRAGHARVKIEVVARPQAGRPGAALRAGRLVLRPSRRARCARGSKLPDRGRRVGRRVTTVARLAWPVHREPAFP